MHNHLLSKTFPLGRTVITSNALGRLNSEDTYVGLQRHARGDWGEVHPDDVGMNDQALKDGDRLLSVYEDRNKTKFWIITEWDRSATTILLPEDY